MSYVCTSEGNYKIRVLMYRDCLCVACAEFDTDASIAIYNCGEDLNCTALSQNDTLGHAFVNFRNIRVVEPPTFDCLIPPEVCVSEARYEFETRDLGLTLEPNGEPYVFITQRCCRNVGVANLVEPSQDQGTSFSIVLSPEAMGVCNSSPTFISFPPTIICSNEDFDFDHGARDSDGDSIVYYFCAPYGGGGRLGAGCLSAKPLPSCPPDNSDGTYASVLYQSPFTGSNPLPGTLDIDRLSGRITGKPDRSGRFVVGVCIDEYRENTLLSTSRRDFQFNIEDCDPEIDARMNGEVDLMTGTYEYNVCGKFTQLFENQSVREELIDEWLWRFDINGEIIEIKTWDATVTFPGLGQYTGSLILNPETTCGDTAMITINVRPGIVADFNFDFDSCVGFPIQFKDLSFTMEEPILSYLWEFDDGDSSMVENPNHLYVESGDYNVKLTVTDAGGCIDMVSKEIAFYPLPLNIIVDAIASDRCAPVDVFFDNGSRPLDSTYSILWDFGDGHSSTDISPTHTYEDEGLYDVSVLITSSNGCNSESEFKELVEVLESPVARIGHSPDHPNISNPVVHFTDKSILATSISWDVANLSASSAYDFNFEFPDTGLYHVSLYAFHENGCIDTARVDIDINAYVSYFLPSAFTPNGDGINDIYIGVGSLNSVSNFSFSIWNKWGEKVFETFDPGIGWNGRKNNQGILIQPGVYMCYVKFIDGDGKLQEVKSYATLIQ